jgi:hypothetical protein
VEVNRLRPGFSREDVVRHHGGRERVRLPQAPVFGQAD